MSISFNQPGELRIASQYINKFLRTNHERTVWIVWMELLTDFGVIHGFNQNLLG